MTIEINQKKKMQSYQITGNRIDKLSQLQERINQNGTNLNPISKNSLVAEALDLLFLKHKI